jgi:TPR repeat protein
MKQRIKTLCVGGVLALALFGVAAAGPLEDAKTAYQKGDYAATIQLIRPLAEQGNAIAQDSLGYMYDRGEGVLQDYEQAVKWMRTAADHGDAFAQGEIGDMYMLGHGVPHDRVLAYMWLNLAAAQGDPLAPKTRDVVAAHMSPDQIAEAQRPAREWKPK